MNVFSGRRRCPLAQPPAPPAPPPGPRAERKSLTRAAILAAARARFVERGFEATTIRDVAMAAGVAVGTIHAHFPDKTALLFACFLDQIDEAVALGLESLDRGAPLIDQLCHLGRVLYAAYARHPALSRQMFAASLFPEGEAAARTGAQIGEFLHEVAGLYAAAGLGPPEALPARAQGWFAAYLLALIAGLAGHHGPLDQPGAVEGQVAQLRALLTLQLPAEAPCPSPSQTSLPS
jgi:AcrR family transcriptional regulator